LAQKLSGVTLPCRYRHRLDGGELLISTGVSAAMEIGKSLAFYARTEPSTKGNQGSKGNTMRKRFKWQICGMLLPAALVPAALAGLAVSATQASAQALDPSTTMVQASPASASVGQAVTLTAEVSCPADPSTGLGVTFFDGSNLLATVPVDSTGDASLATNFSAAGSHVITAAYNGDSNCAASNNTTTVDVTSSPTSPGLLGPVLGDINIGNYTYNDINSHNKSS
jgi:Bacterial Ig-like domain (group 3)